MINGINTYFIEITEKGNGREIFEPDPKN